MPTVSRPIVDVLIAHNGVYPGDENLPPVVTIVRYKSKWDTIAYGLVYRGAKNGYLEETEYIREPEIIWSREEGKT